MDWLRKRRYNRTAECFLQEAEVQDTPQLNDLINLAGANRLHPHGFLATWWQTFWEMYCTRLLATTSSALDYGGQASISGQTMSGQTMLGQAMSPASLLQHLHLSSQAGMPAMSPFPGMPIPQQMPQMPIPQMPQMPQMPIPQQMPVQPHLANYGDVQSPKRLRGDFQQQQQSMASEYTQWFMQQPPTIRQQILTQHQQLMTQQQQQQQQQRPAKKSVLPSAPPPLAPAPPPPPSAYISVMPTAPSAAAVESLPKAAKPIMMNVGSASAPASQVGSPTSLARRRSSLANQLEPVVGGSGTASAPAGPLSPPPPSASLVDPESFFNLDASQQDGSSAFPFQSYRELQGHQGKAVSCAWSHDALLLATGGHDQVVRIWSVSQAADNHRRLVYLGSLEGIHTAPIAQVRFAPHGRRLLATASFDKTVRLFDFGPEGVAVESLRSITAQQLPPMTEHGGPVLSLDFLPAPAGQPCTRLASCDADGWLLQWDATAVLNAQSAAVLEGEGGNALAAYSVLHRCNLQEMGAPDVTVRQIKYQPRSDDLADSVPLLAVANGTSVLFLSPTTGEQVGRLETGWSKQIVSLAWSADPQWPELLVLASADTVGLWRDPRSPMLASYQLPSDRINICTLMRVTNQQALQQEEVKVLFGTYRMIYAWRVKPNDPVHSSPPVSIEGHGAMVAGLSVTRCGGLLLASVAHDGSVRVWSTTPTPIGLCSAVMDEAIDLDFFHLTGQQEAQRLPGDDLFN